MKQCVAESAARDSRAEQPASTETGITDFLLTEPAPPFHEGTGAHRASPWGGPAAPRSVPDGQGDSAVMPQDAGFPEPTPNSPKSRADSEPVAGRIDPLVYYADTAPPAAPDRVAGPERLAAIAASPVDGRHRLRSADRVPGGGGRLVLAFAQVHRLLSVSRPVHGRRLRSAARTPVTISRRTFAHWPLSSRAGPSSCRRSRVTK